MLERKKERKKESVAERISYVWRAKYFTLQTYVGVTIFKRMRLLYITSSIYLKKINESEWKYWKFSSWFNHGLSKREIFCADSLLESRRK